jgi:hypothetical protein
MAELKGIDNWITGHYGADQPSEPEDWRVLEDDGYMVLESAIRYLKREDYPDWDVSEAVEELLCALSKAFRNGYGTRAFVRSDKERA